MCLYFRESLKIPKKYSESVYRRRRRRRRRDNTIAKRK
jgi:hypothetical protein